MPPHGGKAAKLKQEALRLGRAMGPRPTVRALKQQARVIAELIETGDWTAHQTMAGIYGRMIWVLQDYGQKPVERLSKARQAEAQQYARHGLQHIAALREAGGSTLSRQFDPAALALIEQWRRDFSKLAKAR